MSQLGGGFQMLFLDAFAINYWPHVEVISFGAGDVPHRCTSTHTRCLKRTSPPAFLLPSLGGVLICHFLGGLTIALPGL